MFLAFYMLSRVHESDRWVDAATAPRPSAPLRRIFSVEYRRRTLLNTALVTISIIGLWAAAVYEPGAIATLARRTGLTPAEATRLASLGTGLLSVGTCLGCLALPVMAERFGRRPTHAVYFLGMAVCISVSFGWVFYLPGGLSIFIGSLFFLGLFGGNFAMYNLWLPEQYPTAMRATAFAFVTSFGRYIGAGVNFLIGMEVHAYGSVGMPVATTALAFLVGVTLLPLCLETRGERLPA